VGHCELFSRWGRFVHFLHRAQDDGKNMGCAAKFDWLMRVGVLFGTDGLFFIIKARINMKVWIRENTQKKVCTLILFFGRLDQKNMLYFFGLNLQKKDLVCILFFECFHVSKPSYQFVHL
jgi:hypothetical protein